MRDAQEFEFYESKIHASGGEDTADFEAHAKHIGTGCSIRCRRTLVCEGTMQSGGSEHIQHGGGGDGFGGGSALKVKFIR